MHTLKWEYRRVAEEEWRAKDGKGGYWIVVNMMGRWVPQRVDFEGKLVWSGAWCGSVGEAKKKCEDAHEFVTRELRR